MRFPARIDTSKEYVEKTRFLRHVGWNMLMESILEFAPNFCGLTGVAPLGNVFVAQILLLGCQR